MLATIAAVLATFVFLVARSYRRAARSGERYQPEGKLRWDEAPK